MPKKLFFGAKNLLVPTPILRRKPCGRRVLRKRHWALGGSILAAGAWVASNTTASIPPQGYELNAQNIGPQSSVPVAPVYPGAPAGDDGVEPGAVDMLTEYSDIFNTRATDPETWITHEIRRNETLGSIFGDYGFDSELPLAITRDATGKMLKKIRIGQELRFRVDRFQMLDKLVYQIDPLSSLVIDIGAGSDRPFSASIEPTPYKTVRRAVSGIIESSLYEAAHDTGVSIPTIMQMAEIFGWDIDFALDLRRGDAFTLVFEEYFQDGTKLADGHILAAEFVNGGRIYQAIRFTDSEGNSDYYTPSGRSMRGSFLRTPVKFSRISSGFSTGRYHPILKRWRAHKGVDYAAPTGTPVRATADGEIVQLGRKGGYGRSVTVRHAGRIETLYAHLSRFRKPLQVGQRVNQGDVIGYVGSTGLATGPHLHYEFRVKGVHRNPLTYKTARSAPLGLADMERFIRSADFWSAAFRDGAASALAKLPDAAGNDVNPNSGKALTDAG